MQIKKQCKYDETSKRLNICLYISKTLFKGFLDACRHRNTNNTFSTNERKLPIKLAYTICISMLNLSVDLSLYLIKMCICCNVSTKYNAYQKFLLLPLMLQVLIPFEILRLLGLSTYVTNFYFIPRFISFSCIYNLNFIL